MPLHHLFRVAASYGGNLALAAAEDKNDFKMKGTAYVFDLRTAAQIRQFPVRFENVYGNVGLSHRHGLGFASCYQVYGLAAYSLKTGQEVWRRKDLKALLFLEVSSNEDFLFCTSDDHPGYVIDVATGKTVHKQKGLRRVWPSLFDESVILSGRNIELHAPFGRKLATFKRTGDYLHPCIFSRTAVVLNEPDCLRCYDLRSRDLLWSYQRPEQSLPGLYFCEPLHSFVLMETFSNLLLLDERTGSVTGEVALAVSTGWSRAFCRRGSQILAANLQLLSTETGALLADLATPELLAWDPEARMERFKELAASGRTSEELERYMVSEGFSKNDVNRVLLMKYSNDRKKT